MNCGNKGIFSKRDSIKKTNAHGMIINLKKKTNAHGMIMG